MTYKYVVVFQLNMQRLRVVADPLNSIRPGATAVGTALHCNCRTGSISASLTVVRMEPATQPCFGKRQHNLRARYVEHYGNTKQANRVRC